MKPFHTVLTLLAALMMLGATAQESPLRLTLSDARHYAVEHAFEVKNARLDALSAEREVKETLARGLPQLNGSVEYNNFIDIPIQVARGDVFGLPSFINDFLGGVSQATGVPINAPNTDPNAIQEFQFGASQTVTAGIQATQLVFDGSYFIALQASRSYANAMRESIRKSESEVLQGVSEAYHTALVSGENTRILRESLELIESTFNETRQLYDAGFAEELDLDQLELSVADLRSRIRYAELQNEAALDLLKFRMGMPLGAPIELSSTIEELIADNDPALLQAGFDPRMLPEYKVQRSYVELAGLGVKLERAKLLPSIGAFYTNQRNAQRFEFDLFDRNGRWYPIQLWGIQMNVPIFGSGLARHRIERSKVELLRAEAALEQLEQGARLEHRLARIEFENALEQRTIQRSNLTLAERIFNRSRIKYTEGLSSSIELTQVRNQLLTAQGNYINSTLQVLNARIRLNKALNNL